MKYLVQSTHRWSGTKSDEAEVEAANPRAAVRKFVRAFGSLGMLNYIKPAPSYDPARESCFEVMGTSGMVLDVTVSREVRR